MSSFYRCENEFGGDPCTLAKENRKIPDSDVKKSMDGGGPICPGKTLSGKGCGCELILLGGGDPINWKKYMMMLAGGILVLAVLISFSMKSLDSTDDKKSPDIASDPPPRTVTPPPESRDPWWVYQQLETSSKILRTEP